MADPASYTGRFLAEVLDAALPFGTTGGDALERHRVACPARLTRLARIPADVSKRLLLLACAVAVAAGRVQHHPAGNRGRRLRYPLRPLGRGLRRRRGPRATRSSPTSRRRALHLLLDLPRRAGARGAPHHPARSALPTSTRSPTATAPSQDGGAVGIASLADDGIWTTGAAAQVQDDPPGIVVPYGPATDPNLHRRHRRQHERHQHGDRRQRQHGRRVDRPQRRLLRERAFDRRVPGAATLQLRLLA